MDRTAKKDEAKAAQQAKREAEWFKQHASAWDKAMEIVKNKAYIKDGYTDVLSTLMDDAGCLEAEDLQFASKQVLRDIADCLREAPKNRFAALAEVTLRTTGAASTQGSRAHSRAAFVSPPPVGHILAAADDSDDASDNTSDTE